MLGLRPSKLVFRPHAGLFLPRQVLIFYLALVQGDGTETKDSQAEGGPYWSLMFEVSESELKAVNNEEESFAGGALGRRRAGVRAGRPQHQAHPGGHPDRVPVPQVGLLFLPGSWM